MTYRIVFTSTASKDIVDVWDYHESTSSVTKADKIVNGILKLTDSLETLPNRYRSLGYIDYRCVSVGIYLVVYRVIENVLEVSIEMIFDNRQDPMKLLEKLR